MWLRRDLRLADHPALFTAAAAADRAGTGLTAVFVCDPVLLAAGANRTGFLLRSLSALRDAGFLVMDLHLPWQRGAAWSMTHLVDGDIASNQHGWQWTARTGTDAAPYFRVFNPTSALRSPPCAGAASVCACCCRLEDVPSGVSPGPVSRPRRPACRRRACPTGASRA
jgi:deoxyribodipyrimidine photolyase